MEAPRTPLAGRYRYLNSYKTADGTVRWSAIDAEGGKPVLAAVLPVNKLAQLDAVRGAKHLHLSAILDVVREPEPNSLPGGLRLPAGAAVAVAELVSGLTLRGQLKRGRIHPYKAVAWALRLADALATIHQKGSVHGGLSPRSVVVEPVGRAIAPVLAQLVAPTLAAYCSPARLQGSGPSQEDDVWALHAVLYSALTGAPPYSGTGDHLLHGILRGSLGSLAEAGVAEPGLQTILERGLAADESRRVSSLSLFTQSLDAWERGKEPEPLVETAAVERPASPRVAELFFDEPMLPDEDSVEVPRDGNSSPVAAPGQSSQDLLGRPRSPAGPPPLPRQAAAPASRSGRKSWKALWYGLGSLGLAGGIGGLIWTVTSSGSYPKPKSHPEEPRITASASVPSAEPKEAELTPAEQNTQCVVSFFEEENIPPQTPFDFICSDEDFRELSSRVFQVVGALKPTADAGVSAGAGIVVRANANAYDLGWFELTSAAIIRTSCCPKASPITLPETSGWCQQLQGEVRAVAEASKKPIELSPYARRFEDAVVCLFATGTRRPYRYDQAPTPANSHAFQRFLKRVAESESKRSAMKWLQPAASPK